MIALPQVFLAWRSLRSRRATFLATFCSVALATALIGSFATLIETANGDGVTAADHETLIIMGLVVGSWGAIIALFSLASTIGITVRQRDAEIGLLRTIGSTPRQARRMIRLEILAIAVMGTALGAAAASAGGAGLLALLRSGDLVAATVEHRGGVISLGGTAVALLLVSVLAASLAGHKATRGEVRLASSEGQSGAPRMRRWRTILGVALVGYGVAMAALTVTVMKGADDPFAPMQTAGSAAIVTSVGMATLAPLLLRWSAVALRPVLKLGGAAGYLAGFNASRRAHVLAGILSAVVVFTATTVGVLMMVGIDGRTLDAMVTDKQEAQTITLLNYVVTGMIALFAAIMIVNSLVAVIGQRRAEFAGLQLAGATREQVRSSVLAEASVVAGVGVLIGLAASTATVIPYSLARDEGVLPAGQLWLPAVMVAVAIGITLTGASVAARRTLDAVRDTGPRAAVAA